MVSNKACPAMLLGYSEYFDTSEFLEGSNALANLVLGPVTLLSEKTQTGYIERARQDAQYVVSPYQDPIHRRVWERLAEKEQPRSTSAGLYMVRLCGEGLIVRAHFVQEESGMMTVQSADFESSGLCSPRAVVDPEPSTAPCVDLKSLRCPSNGTR